MASLYDSASLVMLPSGVKESKVYSIKPTDGSGDFTFSRGTDTATRVNASGLIEKERSNQLLQSNSFDTTWQVNGVTLTSGQSGYDGTNDAWLLQRVDGVARFVYQTISTTEVATFSVYVKEGNTDWVYINTINTTAYFDLSGSGAVGLTTGSDLIDANIESIGSGWFRVSIAANGIDGVRVYPAVGNGAISGASGANIYIQDAMLNAGLVAQPYIETTTAAVYEGITDNLPRLDYSGGASCPSLLLEPSRTNELPNSEYLLSGSGWNANDLNLEANAATSPEGVQNATKIIPTTNNVVHSLYKTSEPHLDHIYSAFVKADGYNWVLFTSHASSVPKSRGAFFYIADDGTAMEDRIGATGGGIVADIEDYGNGWFRISIDDGSSPSSLFSIIPSNADDVDSFAGDGTSGILVYGLQNEAGSYPTSYIPTYGTSASRAGDVCRKEDAADLIGQTEGSFFYEFEMSLNNAIGTPICISEYASTSNFILVYQLQSNTLSFRVRKNSVDQFNITSDILTKGKHKFAFAYKENDCVFYVDGVQIGTSTNCQIPANLNRLSLVDVATGINKVDSAVNQALVFKTRLTNAELAALTTL